MEKELLSSIKSRQLELSKRTLDSMLACGTTEARIHVDIDPEIGLSHFENMLLLREEYSSHMSIELVAFPQQGLLRSNSVPYLREALIMGADAVGGVDPAGVDRNVERCLDNVFQLAVEFDAEIDLHLHDPGHLGVYTIEKMLDFTEMAGWRGKVAVSHAYCLGEVDAGVVHELAERMAEEQMTVITSVPIDSAMPPIEILISHGVSVDIGTDHTGLDAWTPYGDPDLLRRGRRLAEKLTWNDDSRMAFAFGLISPKRLELQVGAPADFVLVKALNPQHALAISPPRDLVCKRGVPVSGSQLKNSWVCEKEEQ